VAHLLKPPASKRYTFGDPIGSGGMGTVFRARDRNTGMAVAIKVLKATLAENPMMHHRLAQEFRAATQLEHPNIVRAIEIETDGSTSYLVFELVEGLDLGQRIENAGPMPEEAAVRIVTQIAQALHYAHLKQVIHRDVKPDNILVLPDGRAKLTDFGLAKDYNNDLDLTRHASGLGTPHFMAPEQFASAKTATVRCDVYSLGATLYNALTGELPFDAEFGLAILANKEKDPPSVRKVVPGISQRVDDAIRQALDKNPSKRPESCLDFFRLLTARSRFDDGRDSTALSRNSPAVSPPKSAEANRRAWIRHELSFGACATIDTAVFGGGEDTEEIWPLTIRDVSIGGVGVVLARRFEAGTELMIEVGTGPSSTPRRLPVKVVRIEPDSVGHWVHGCAFASPLSEDELNALLRYT
jgi:serine/threonine protein kinase